mmetsp:Transcript_9992/g.9932  ORF Transcript_9992/g.9932 Transcript_9992/m.9932 type:complete len:233 (-) Transcript_9992:82-780(-)
MELIFGRHHEEDGGRNRIPLFLFLLFALLLLFFLPFHEEVLLGLVGGIVVSLINLGLSAGAGGAVLVDDLGVQVELLLLLLQRLQAPRQLIRLQPLVLPKDLHPPVVELDPILKQTLLHVDLQDFVPHCVIYQVQLLDDGFGLLGLPGDVELDQEAGLLVEVVVEELLPVPQRHHPRLVLPLNMDNLVGEVPELHLHVEDLRGLLEEVLEHPFAPLFHQIGQVPVRHGQRLF